MVSALRLERVIKEMTQTELARRTGIPQWRISLVERGKQPSLAEVKAIATALGVSPADLFPAQETQL